MFLAERPHEATDQELQAALDQSTPGAETEFTIRCWCQDHGMSRWQLWHKWEQERQKRCPLPSRRVG